MAAIDVIAKTLQGGVTRYAEKPYAESIISDLKAAGYVLVKDAPLSQLIDLALLEDGDR